MNNYFFIVDGNSFMHRAFNAIPPLTNKNGFPTNAITGTLNMINSLIEKFNPENIVVAFDVGGKKNFRYEIDPNYKANRSKMDNDLKVQFAIVKSVLDKWGIKRLEVEGVEADDSMATLAKKLAKNGKTAVLVTSDKDLRALVSENILILDTKDADKNGIPYGIEGVIEKEGVHPNKIIEKLSLMGDKADNILGVAGVGEKTAIKLIDKYGSADLIFENLDKEKGKLKENLENGKENYFLAKQLVTINTNVEIKKIEEYQNTEIQKEELAELLNEYGLKTLIRKLKLETELSKNLKEIKLDLINLSTENLSEELTIYQNEEIIYIMENNKSNKIYKTNKEYFENKRLKKISGLDIKENLKFLNLNNITLHDVNIADYVINGNINIKKDVFDLFEETTGIRLDKNKIENKIFAINELVKLQEEKICKENLNVFNKLEQSLNNVLSYMEKNGIKVKETKLKEIGLELDNKIKEIQSQIFNISKVEFNINSPKQVAKILFEDLGIESKKKSTSENVLKLLEKNNPIIALILKYRSLSKMKSTYVTGLIKHIKNERIHTKYNQTKTNTGRLSSEEPNLQSIPIKTKEGRKIREAFVAKEGYKIVALDYSQIELRLLAHLSKEEKLINAFNNGEDIHKTTASEIFNVDIKNVSAEQRRISKAINFGLIYGMSGKKLAEDLGIETKEANKYKKLFFEKYEKIKPFMESELIFAKENGYIETLNKRKIYFPEINSKDSFRRSHAERAANNASIQGTAADLIKKAMIEIFDNIKENNDCKMLLQVHDELVFEIKEDKVNDLSNIISKKMENSEKLLVPLKVEFEIANNWLEAH